MRIRNHQDFWAGVMFIALGLFFVIFAQAYQMGTAAKMGPGYFPTMLGLLMAGLGAIIAGYSTAKSNPEARLAPVGWREIFLILGAVMLFAATLPYLGMVVSITLLIAVSAMASYEFSWKAMVAEVIVLLLMAELVFVKGLELQFPVWPRFITGN